MNKIQTALLTGGLVVASIVSPMTSFAQGSTSSDPMYNQSPQGSTGNTGTTGTTNTQNDNTGFDWRWLLPLLAIPIVYLLTRKSEDKDHSRSRDTGQYSVGAKGGRSSRKDDE